MKSIVTALVDPSGAADYGPDAYVEIWSALPVGAGASILTDDRLRVPITSSGLSTPPIRAGNYLIRMKLASSRTALGPYPFTMPDGDGTTELWPLIAAGVNIPGDTPIDGNGLDQSAVDTRVQTVGDTRYVPVPGDAGTTGQVLSKTSTGTAWVAPPSGGGGAGLTDDGTGLFTISSGSSITEDSSNPGLYLIGA